MGSPCIAVEIDANAVKVFYSEEDPLDRIPDQVDSHVLVAVNVVGLLAGGVDDQALTVGEVARPLLRPIVRDPTPPIFP